MAGGYPRSALPSHELAPCSIWSGGEVHLSPLQHCKVHLLPWLKADSWTIKRELVLGKDARNPLVGSIILSLSQHLCCLLILTVDVNMGGWWGKDICCFLLRNLLTKWRSCPDPINLEFRYRVIWCDSSSLNLYFLKYFKVKFQIIDSKQNVIRLHLGLKFLNHLRVSDTDLQLGRFFGTI